MQRYSLTLLGHSSKASRSRFPLQGCQAANLERLAPESRLAWQKCCWKFSYVTQSNTRKLHRSAHAKRQAGAEYAEEDIEIPATSSRNLEKRLMLIDAHALMFRFHHALGKAVEGKPAMPSTYGVMKTMLDMLEVSPPPSHLAIVMDSPGKTFRHEMFTEYKGHRPPFPEEIKEAIPQLTALLKSLNVPLLREPGVEADDVIGSLTIKAHSEGFQVAIVSPDKDFFQLLRPNVFLLRAPKRDMTPKQLWGNLAIFSSLDFEAKYKIQASQWRDALAIIGDTADNVPGVAGIGEKGAMELLRQFQSLDNILENIGQITKTRHKNALSSKDVPSVARLSQALVTIHTDLDVPSVTQDLSNLAVLPLTLAEKQKALHELEAVGLKEQTQRWSRVWASRE